MVAFFRYSPIDDILSVRLPPAILDFNASGQEWIRKEADEVIHKIYLDYSCCYFIALPLKVVSISFPFTSAAV